MKKTLAFTCLIIFGITFVFAQNIKTNSPSFLTSSKAYTTIPLRDMQPITKKEWQQMVREAEDKLRNKKDKINSYPFGNIALPKGNDPVWQQWAPTNRGANGPIQNFEGTPSAYWPSDVNGSVSSTHYVQTTNSLFSIYTKTGTKLVGPLNINSIFGGVPGGGYNDGDPVVLFDDQADRWLLSEFSYSGPNDYLLVAISQTNDPTGSWYAYSFDVDDFPDYPKFGVWRDAYYVGINKGSTSINGQEDVFALERSKMILGQTAQFIGFENTERPNSHFQLASPIDNDGTFASSGTPGLFVCINDDGWNGIKDQIWIYEMDVDWTTPSNSTFQRVQAIDVAAFDSDFGSSRENIDQLGTSNQLDAAPRPVMNSPQYHNFGSHQTIVLSHNVDVDGTDHAGMRWYELRKTSNDWELRQQGTYSPDANSRWMGSVAINNNQRISLGYSISSSTLYPGIRYAAQSPSAYSSANGLLDVAEETILTGTNSQLTSNRWGDYTNISIDPGNDSVFWYTNQYISSTGGRNTKIASFKFGPFGINADFVVSDQNPEINTTVQLTDMSYGSPTSWLWSFSPSTVTYVGGTSAASQNPQVQFTVTGSYTVSLKATKGGNNDTETKTSHIDVTPLCTISAFPWTEGFENGGNMPDCWDQKYVTIENRDWQFAAGNGGTDPSNSHTGSYNAYLKDGSFTEGKTKLITPELDLSGLTNAQVDFWHTQYLYFSVYDKMKVFYKTSASGSWTEIGDYSSAIGSWTHDSLSLPNLSSTYYIAFEGNAISGNGVCLDDIQVKEGPSCPFPVSLSETNITSTAVKLNWIEGGTATEWEIEYGAQGFSQGSGITISSVTSNPYTLSGLSYSTSYDWYVRAKCSSSSSSIWIGPSNFTTLQQLFSLPMTEDFESGFTKFDNVAGNSTNWQVNTSLKHGGSQSVKNAYTPSNTNILYETGIMDLSSAILPTLTFWHIAETESSYDYCYVEVSTDGGSNYSVIPNSAYQGSASTYSSGTRFDESSYTEWANGNTPDNTWWKKETFSLSAYNTSSVKIRFKLTSDGTTERDGWYIDDIAVEVPSCPQPGSPSTSNITANTVNFNWTEQGSATTWDIEYGTTGFTQGTGTSISGTTSNPYSLSGLTASTSYDWYVRSSCGGGDYSIWVGPTTFLTICTASTVPYLEDFESSTKPIMPSCMAAEDANSDSKTWKSSDTYAGQLSGSLSAEISASVSLASDDWMFTNGLQLSAGVEYEVGFAYRAAGGFADEKLEMKWGNSPTSAAMTLGTLWQKIGFTNEGFELASATFTPSSSGIYYIGIHAFSSLNKYGIFVDDIYVVVSSKNAVWTGSTDNAWWTASNWGNDTLPGSQTSVEIPAGLTNYPTLTNIAPCNNFLIKSSASGTASILDNGRLFNQGQITIQRYLTSGKWHLVSSPVNNATVNSLYFNGNPNVWLKKYNESSNDWTFITSLSTSMPFGGGFSVWVDAGNDTIANFVGDILNEDLYFGAWSTPPINFTDASHGYNLMGNPFPSPLNWDNTSAWNLTDMEGTVWVWNQAISNYVYRNSIGQGDLTNGIIPLGQGFFVRATSMNNNMGITQQCRTHSGQPYYKASKNKGDTPFAVIKASKNNMLDEVWVTFADGATDDYDNGMDVRKMFSDYNAPQLYFEYNYDSLSIIASPLQYNNTRIFDLHFKVGENGSQNLVLDQTYMMWDTDIFLEDLFLNKFIDFKQYPDYNFEAFKTDETNRFKIHFVNLYTDVQTVLDNDEIVVFSDNGSIYVKTVCDKYKQIPEIEIVNILGQIMAITNTCDDIYRFNNLRKNQFYFVRVSVDNSVIVKKVFLK